MGTIAGGRGGRRPRRRLAPLRTCASCGRTFRSWSEDRYCGRAPCTELRLFGPDGNPAPAESSSSSHDPATAPWPEGF